MSDTHRLSCESLPLVVSLMDSTQTFIIYSALRRRGQLPIRTQTVPTHSEERLLFSLYIYQYTSGEENQIKVANMLLSKRYQQFHPLFQNDRENTVFSPRLGKKWQALFSTLKEESCCNFPFRVNNHHMQACVSHPFSFLYQGEDTVEYFLGLTPSGIIVLRNKTKVGNYFW